jgi:hypothetical protein
MTECLQSYQACQLQPRIQARARGKAYQKWGILDRVSFRLS